MSFHFVNKNDWRINQLKFRNIEYDTIDEILQRLFPDSENSIVSILEPGLSGFSVLSITFEEYNNNMHLVMKIKEFSKDDDKTIINEEESSLFLKNKNKSNHTFIQCNSAYKLEIKDKVFTVLIFNLVNEKVTFREYLKKLFIDSAFDINKCNSVIDNTILSFDFNNWGYKIIQDNPWTQELNQFKTLSQSDYYQLYLENIYKIINSRPDLAESLEIKEVDINNLLAFINCNKYKNKLIDPKPERFPISIVHGDLNGGNILVDKNQGLNPAFIDFSQMSKKPDRHILYDIGKITQDFERFILPINSFDNNITLMLKSWVDTHNFWIQEGNDKTNNNNVQPIFNKLYNILSIFKNLSIDLFSFHHFDKEIALRHFLYIRLHFILRIINYSEDDILRKLFAIRASIDILECFIGTPRIKSLDKNILDNNNSSIIYDNSESNNFIDDFVLKLENAKNLVLIGTGINLLHRDTITFKIMELIEFNNLKVELFLANPYSPAVQLRLIEEELGEIKPGVGESGLINRIKSLIQQKNLLSCTDNFIIKLFDNYPTFAMLIIDNKDFFIYPYAYKTLGNSSPVLYFNNLTKTDKLYIFLNKQYKNIKNDSIDFSLRFNNDNLNVNETISMGIYFIPPKESDIYTFGKNILGYDIYDNCNIDSIYQDYVGDSKEFGFHLTIADILYFASKHEIEFICKEMEFIGRKFSRFKLHDFKLSKNFPDINSISINVHETSGNLEALHFEMVSRVYSKALASNYTLKNNYNNRVKNIQRADTMKEKYKAPLILNEFKPHFTLLSKVPNQKMSEIYDKINKDFQELKSTSIEFNHFYIMLKDNKINQWKVYKKITLGSQT